MQLDFWTYKARYCSNYDGDTVSLDLDLGFHIKKFDISCRLHGINCSELKGLTYDKGLQAKIYVRSRLESADTEIVVKSIKDSSCKYGRPLVILYYKTIGDPEFKNLNQELLDQGLAEPYII